MDQYPRRASRIVVRALALPATMPTVAPSHPYCEQAWLPVIGPTSWLVWRTFARSLVFDPAPTWYARDLARHHGVRADRLHASLARLTSFGLAYTPPAAPDGDPDAVVHVAAVCPPLWPSLLRRSAPQIRSLHRATFPRETP